MKDKMHLGYMKTLLVAFFFFMIFQERINFVKAEESVFQENSNEKQTPVRLTVILQRFYLNGDMSEEVVTNSFLTREDCLSKYDQWKLVSEQEGRLVFQREMDDISPLLKSNGYFGITEEGILTIFNGRPQNSKVIQSFFQIDMGRLESRRREQLIKGIPVKSKHRYEKVLETFAQYTVGEKQAK